MGRRPIHHRLFAFFIRYRRVKISGITPGFPGLSPCDGQVTYVLLTRLPLSLARFDRSRRKLNSARLACVRHAASVRPEPGSNSHVKSFDKVLRLCLFTGLILFARPSLDLTWFFFGTPFFETLRRDTV